MKKIAVTLVLCFAISFAFAQDTKKNVYVQKGDLIEATLYHDNGTVSQTGFYSKENKLQGEWTSYDAQGNKTAVAEYNNGKKVGTWFFYQGDTLKEVSYNDARMASVKTYKVTEAQVVSNFK